MTLAVRATVVSFSHEFLVDLFRTRGELAPTLLRLCKGMVLDHARAEQRSIDLSQVMPTEYRADAVVVLHDHRDAIVAAVIVEVQLNVDRDKERTWPVYITALRHKLACPVILAVVTPSEDVARWARQPIDIGHPGLCLVPVVVELKSVPRIVDPAEVQGIPELGVLSAIAHPEVEVATTALDAASQLPEDRAKLYWDVILAALPPSVRKALEAPMQGYVYQSEFARKYYSQGLEKGLEQGLEKGLEQGLEKGLEQGLEKGLEQGLSRGLRRAVLALVRARLDVVTSEEEATIDAVGDARALTELLDALVRATTALEVRAALDAARSGG